MIGYSVTTLIIFGFLVILVGAWAARKGLPTAEDYYLGGRSIGVTATFFGVMATQLSGFIFLGMVAMTFMGGVGPMAQMIGGAVQIPLLYYVFQRMNELGKQYNYITQADYLVDRYDGSKFFRIVPAVLGIIAITAGHFVIQFIATGYIFNVLTGGMLPYAFGVIYTAVIVALVVVVGGFRATAWVDIVLGIWLLLVLIAIPFIMLSALGMNFFTAMATFAERFPQLASLPGPAGQWKPQTIFSWMIVMAGFTMYPHMFMRSFAAADKNFFGTLSILWIPAMVLSVGVVMISGALANLIWAGPQEAGVPPDGVLIHLLVTFTSSWVTPFLIAGALAAIVSTLIGNVIGLTSLVMNDLVKSLGKENMQQKTMVRWSRIVVGIATLAAMFLALGQFNTITQLFVSANGIVVLFLVPIVGGLIWPRLNRQGAIAGLAVGEIALLWLTYGPKSLGGGFMANPAYFGFMAAIWALLVTIVVTVAVSLLTPAPSEKLRAKFFGHLGYRVNSQEKAIR